MVNLVGYMDSRGEWRWRLIARNGRIIADSGEGYSKLGNLQRAMALYKRMLSVKVRVRIEKPEPATQPPIPRILSSLGIL